MRIDSSFVLLSARKGEAFALFRGNEIAIRHSLLDERLFHFVAYFQESLSPAPIESNLYSNLEMAELVDLFRRNGLVTAKPPMTNEADYLAYLDEKNMFSFKDVEQNIFWCSILDEEMNRGIESNLNFKKVEISGDLNPEHFYIFFADNYNRKEILRVAKIFHEKKLNWLYVGLNQFDFLLGPVGSKTSSFCLYCVFERLGQNSENPETFENFQGKGFAPGYSIPTFFLSILVGHLKNEIIKFFTDNSSKLVSGLFQIGLYQPSAEFSHILPYPSCRVCREHHRTT